MYSTITGQILKIVETSFHADLHMQKSKVLKAEYSILAKASKNKLLKNTILHQPNRAKYPVY